MKSEPMGRREYTAPLVKFTFYCYPHDVEYVTKSCGECRVECPGASKNKIKEG